jgi:protein-tyrosine phosphatase
LHKLTKDQPSNPSKSFSYSQTDFMDLVSRLPLPPCASLSSILPGHLYLGNWMDAYDAPDTKLTQWSPISRPSQHNKPVVITHVLNMAHEVPCFHSHTLNYLHIGARDQPEYDLTQHFDLCNTFIKQAIASGGTVLVHCSAGVSRSATVVISYLIQERGMSLNKATSVVKSKRTIIRPNNGFIKQLELIGHKFIEGDSPEEC